MKTMSIEQASSELKSILSVRNQITPLELLETAVMTLLQVPKDAKGSTKDLTDGVQSARTLLLEGSSEKDDPKYLVDCLETYMTNAVTGAKKEEPKPATKVAAKMDSDPKPAVEAFSWGRMTLAMKCILENSSTAIRACLDLRKLADEAKHAPKEGPDAAAPHAVVQYMLSTAQGKTADQIMLAVYDILEGKDGEPAKPATPVVTTPVAPTSGKATTLWCVTHEAFVTDRLVFITSIVEANSEREAFVVFGRHQAAKQAYPHLWREAKSVKQLEVLK